MRQVKGNAPFVGPRGAGTGKQFFICDNIESQLIDGVSYYIPTNFPSSPIPNKGSLFGFNPENGFLCRWVGSLSDGDIGQSQFLISLSDGTTISPSTISLPTYNHSDVYGFSYRIDMEFIPSVFIAPDQYSYRVTIDAVLENPIPVFTELFRVNNTSSLIATVGTSYFPVLGMTATMTNRRLFRNMFRYQER